MSIIYEFVLVLQLALDSRDFCFIESKSFTYWYKKNPEIQFH